MLDLTNKQQRIPPASITVKKEIIKSYLNIFLYSHCIIFLKLLNQHSLNLPKNKPVKIINPSKLFDLNIFKQLFIFFISNL